MSDLIERLEKIKKEEYKFEGFNKDELLEELLFHIGDRDPHVRDDLVYPVLAHLLHDSHFDKKKLLDLTERLLSQEFLLFDMDNDIEHSALIRSFTMLQITILVYVHNRDHLYTEKEFDHLINVVIDYYKSEEILTGYHDEVGFIHAIAHAADTFHQLAKSEAMKDYQMRRLFDAVNMKFDTGRYVFIDDEDERTVTALETMIRSKKIDNEFLLQWVELVSDYNRPKVWPQVYRNHSNIKNLLRSLYFRFIYEDEFKELTEKIKVVLKEKVKLR